MGNNRYAFILLSRMLIELAIAGSSSIVWQELGGCGGEWTVWVRVYLSSPSSGQPSSNVKSERVTTKKGRHLFRKLMEAEAASYTKNEKKLRGEDGDPVFCHIRFQTFGSSCSTCFFKYLLLLLLVFFIYIIYIPTSVTTYEYVQDPICSWKKGPKKRNRDRRWSERNFFYCFLETFEKFSRIFLQWHNNKIFIIEFCKTLVLHILERKVLLSLYLHKRNKNEKGCLSLF